MDAHMYIFICMYIYTSLCNMGCISMLAQFCPEPGKHIGQPADFDDSDSDFYEEEDPPKDMWMWELGVEERRQNDPSFKLR